MGEVTIAIPTRGRQDFLAVLLASIANDVRNVAEVLIIENGPMTEQYTSGVVLRMSELLVSLGVKVTATHIGDVGRQASQARNFAQIHCTSEFLICVDDDMWFEPGVINRMYRMFSIAERRAEGPVVLSALTPYVNSEWDGPKANDKLDMPGKDEKIIEVIPTPGQNMPFQLILKQNCSFQDCEVSVDALRWSDALTPGVYFMRPDISVPNWDISDQSLYTDIAWSLQLEILRGYKFCFDLGSRVYHLHAQSGGTRLGEGNYSKPRKFYEANLKAIEKLLEMKVGSDGV